MYCYLSRMFGQEKRFSTRCLRLYCWSCYSPPCTEAFASGAEELPEVLVTGAPLARQSCHSPSCLSFPSTWEFTGIGPSQRTHLMIITVKGNQDFWSVVMELGRFMMDRGGGGGGRPRGWGSSPVLLDHLFFLSEGVFVFLSVVYICLFRLVFFSGIFYFCRKKEAEGLSRTVLYRALRIECNSVLLPSQTCRRDRLRCQTLLENINNLTILLRTETVTSLKNLYEAKILLG